MKRSLIVLLALVMMLSVFAGCAGSGDAVPGDAAPGSEEEQKQGDQTPSTPSTPTTDESKNRVVVANIGGAASTSDPFAHSNFNDRIWQGNVFEPLFSYNGNTKEYEPRVGKEFTVSEDGLVYTVTLFDDIYFHNGDKCDAEAVKASIEYAKESPYNTIYSGPIDRVEVKDELTFDIILTEPNTPFMLNADRIFIMNTKVAQEQGEAFGTKVNLAGTGAYYIDHYDPAVEIRLLKWDKFHRGDPQIPGITYKIMTDPSAALIAFESGELDFIYDMPATNFKDLKDSGKYNTYLGQTSQVVNYFINNHHSEVLGNKLVRQAMAYAIDYDAVNIGSTEGLSNVNGKLMYAPLTNAAPSGGIIYTYDPEKAKALLVEAGYPDGVDIGEIVCIAGLYHQKIAEIMMEYFAQVGITSTVQPLEQVTCIDEMRLGNYGVGVMSTYNLLDEDYMSLNYDNIANPGTAMAKIADSTDYDWERIHELFVLGREEGDGDKRLDYYTELDNIIMEAAIAVPFFHTVPPYAWDKDLYINTNKSYTYQYTYLWDCYWQ